MSQFDFPRLHFSGSTKIDPATGNNNYFLPLITYDPIHGTVVLPPRIYLQSEKDKESAQALFPTNKEVLQLDEYGNTFISIDPIRTSEDFKNWNITPLGKHALDKEYHPLYKVIDSVNDNKPLAGNCPGYWNYYGTMNFELIDVSVHSIQLQKKGQIQTITAEKEENSPFIGQSLSFNDKANRNRAVMIDVSPTLSLFSQVFSDRLVLQSQDNISLDGKPTKASLRQMNTTRVKNDPSITGASGTFHCTISLDELEDIDHALIQYFRNHIASNVVLKGIYIRYDLHSVREDQNPDYRALGPNANPAHSKILGTISPWVDQDMISASPCRQLLPKAQIEPSIKFGPGFARFDLNSKSLSLDLIGSFPMMVKGENLDKTFTYQDWSALFIKIYNDQTKIDVPIYKHEKNTSFEKMITNKGGIFDVSLRDNLEALSALENKASLQLFAVSTESNESCLVLDESPYYIISDQTALYADQFDDPENGYLSNSNIKEDCQIRIFKYGKPYEKKVPVICTKLSVQAYGMQETTEIYEPVQNIKDGQIFRAPTDVPGHFFYSFVASEEQIYPPNIKNHMLVSNGYINLRVLPKFQYPEYLSTDHEEITTPIDFKLIQSEFLLHYDLIYPASGIITPFEAGYFSKIHKFLLLFMSVESWDKYLYMPSTRDLPKEKRALLFKWLQQEVDKKS